MANTLPLFWVSGLPLFATVSWVQNRNFSFFKQKTAYEMESRDWSSDVCSSD
eukprot:COSAG03_NODE_25383_length_266_cov_0.604790_1_plen_51_part_01